MKRAWLVLLAATMLMCSCNETPAGSSSEEPSSAVSSETVAETSSKKNNASWTLVVENYLREIDGEKYFDVSAAAADGPRRALDDMYFPEVDGFVGYYIEKGVYLVESDTMLRVLNYPFKGDGAIKWDGFKPEGYFQNPDQFDGVLPISKMNDPMYLEMCLPHERNAFSGTKNANVNYEIVADHRTLTPLIAIYLDEEKEDQIPDDAVITLCFGEFKLLACKNDGKGWFVALNSMGDAEHHGPSDLGTICPIPWTLGSADPPASPYNVTHTNSKLLQWVDDHFEIQLTGADFKGIKFNDDRVERAVLHSWGSPFYKYENGDDILGIAAGYTVWVKEPEWSGFLAGDTGADARKENGDCVQTFSSRYFVITDQPRVIYGHNVGPKAYDEVMDSEKVCKLLGIK